MYFGDDALISKKEFNSWRNIDFTGDEKENFDINGFLVFKIIYTKKNDSTEFVNRPYKSKKSDFSKIKFFKNRFDKLKNVVFRFLGNLKKNS